MEVGPNVNCVTERNSHNDNNDDDDGNEMNFTLFHLTIG